MLYNKTIAPAPGLALVDRHEEEQTPTGIYLPRTPRDDRDFTRSFAATVIALGPPRRDSMDEDPVPHPFAVGDSILVRIGYGGTIVTINGRDYLLVPAEAFGGHIVPIQE